MKYRTNSHYKFSIKLHFIFVVKYRKNILIEEIERSVKNTIINVCKKNNYVIDQMESDKNHIHILLDIKPIHSAYQIAHKLKQVTTYVLYQKFKLKLSRHFWRKNTFWSSGYFVCSTGNASTETIKKYIEQQG